jgi:hypothetical protein
MPFNVIRMAVHNSVYSLIGGCQASFIFIQEDVEGEGVGLERHQPHPPGNGSGKDFEI